MERVRPFRPLKRLLRRFRKNESGVAAVEFALVATPFFALLFAILEVALIFFAQQVMDTGVSQAARLIRTGQAKSFDKGQFRDAVCERIMAMFDCEGGLKLDVQAFSSFSNIQSGLDSPTQQDADGNTVLKDDDEFSYDSAALNVGGTIVVVRAFYEWPTIVPGLGADMGTLSDGNRLLVSTIAFRNEPF